MIHVDHGYVLSEAQTQTITFQDSVTTVSRPILVPKIEKALNDLAPLEPGTRYVMVYSASGHKVARSNSLRDGTSAALTTGAGPIEVDALAVKWRGGGYHADAMVKFRWSAIYHDYEQSWAWYRQYSYDGGTTWSTPDRVSSVSGSGDPSELNSWIGYREEGTPQSTCLYYNRRYYHVRLAFGVNFINGSPDWSAAITQETVDLDWWGVILQDDPITHSDNIHTVSAVTS